MELVALGVVSKKSSALFLRQRHNTITCIVAEDGLQRCSIAYLAVRRGLGAGAGRSLSLHLGRRLGNPHPDKVDDMVQVGEEIGSGEPAVVAVLLDAGLLGGKTPVRHCTHGQLHCDEENSCDPNKTHLTSSSLLSWTWLSRPSSIR